MYRVYCNIHIWLVISTPLKNISQLGWLFPIYGKIKYIPNHQPDIHSQDVYQQIPIKRQPLKSHAPQPRLPILLPPFSRCHLHPFDVWHRCLGFRESTWSFSIGVYPSHDDDHYVDDHDDCDGDSDADSHDDDDGDDEDENENEDEDHHVYHDCLSFYQHWITTYSIWQNSLLKLNDGIFYIYIYIIWCMYILLQTVNV